MVKVNVMPWLRRASVICLADKPPVILAPNQFYSDAFDTQDVNLGLGHIAQAFVLYFMTSLTSLNFDCPGIWQLQLYRSRKHKYE